jgi:hypothetical protein
MKGVPLTDRLHLRRRHEGPRPAVTGRMLAAPVAAPAVKAGERPYPDAIAASQVAAYRRAAASEFRDPRPEFHAAPFAAPPTAPIPVVPGAAPDSTLAMPEVLVMRRIRDGLKGLDWTALDAARAHERETYARTSGAPFHNALLSAWRSPVRPARRHGEAVGFKARALAYPEFGAAEVAGMGAYAGVMKHADRITGTRGTGRFRPALPSGGAA